VVAVISKTYFLVFSNPVDDRAEQFNEWYENVHLPDVLSVDGVTSAQRFRCAPVDTQRAAAPKHQHLAMYELDGEPSSVLEAFFERVGSGKMQLSDSLDLSTVDMAVWQPAGERIEK
jgi:hypothetical protein